jgi:hypothetical protein
VSSVWCVGLCSSLFHHQEAGQHLPSLLIVLLLPVNQSQDSFHLNASVKLGVGEGISDGQCSKERNRDGWG